MDGHRFKHAVMGSMREIIFGLEDSLVSTLGAVTGIAAGAESTYIVILSGLVLIAVESTSMAAGSYLSSKSAAEAQRAIEEEEGKKVAQATARPLRAALVMGVCYLLAGFIPLSAYFFLPIDLAFGPSIILTAITLFLVGAWSASISRRPLVRGGMEMIGISLGAAVIGFVIGRAVNVFFGVNLGV
jgi:predicted membrane protein (TIGR00267 family)